MSSTNPVYVSSSSNPLEGFPLLKFRDTSYEQLKLPSIPHLRSQSSLAQGQSTKSLKLSISQRPWRGALKSSEPLHSMGIRVGNGEEQYLLFERCLLESKLCPRLKGELDSCLQRARLNSHAL
ncbi:hypothetical protein RJT34_25071 [Clitoria ternatea]|uniref:Uncharacterized protein n=1 Tax=Clitoria ternatea TaxID=43366 RepID=A0AAN9FR68_CLITE